MLPPVLIISAFALWWAFVLNVLGLMNGWWTLARHYRARAPFDGERFRMSSARLGRSNYGHILLIGVNADGLFLSMFCLFRPGHPPLFVPWSEIDATPAKGWIFRYLDLRFRQAPHLRLRIKHALGLKIVAAANRSWGGEPTDGLGEPKESHVSGE